MSRDSIILELEQLGARWQRATDRPDPADDEFAAVLVDAQRLAGALLGTLTPPSDGQDVRFQAALMAFEHRIGRALDAWITYLLMEGEMRKNMDVDTMVARQRAKDGAIQAWKDAFTLITAVAGLAPARHPPKQSSRLD